LKRKERISVNRKANLYSFIFDPMNFSLAKYDAKVLMAFGETFTEEKGEFLNWLLKNGYPELAALSSAIKGSEEAVKWLLMNRYRHFAALDAAIDKQQPAYRWLLANGHDFLAVFSDAVNQNPVAMQWFKKHDLGVFLLLAKKIHDFRENQTYDYHKMHF